MPAGFDALIPVKQLIDAKSRLRQVLDPGGRARLMRLMFESVLEAAAGSSRIASINVVTSDPVIRDAAARAGASCYGDYDLGLNPAVGRVAHLLRTAHGQGLIVLPADLPWLTTAAIDQLLDQLPCDGAAIASDQHRDGTSALAWSARMRTPRFAFGPGSFDAHLAIARAAGLSPQVIVAHPAFRDVDTPEDVRALAAARPDLALLPDRAA